MMPLSLDIPDSPRELNAWIENHLLGVQLGDLVAELHAVHRNHPGTVSLTEACGGKLDEVLQHGLGRIPVDRVGLLLQHPHLLLELQDAIVQRGGNYWLHRPTPREEQLALASQWKLLEHSISTPLTTVRAVPRNRSGIGRSALAALLSAAAVFTVMWFQRDGVMPPAPGWGWDRPGALAANLPPKDYLEHLATGAEDWFKKRPEAAPELARRIGQFRQGCSTLILAEHPSLAAADRDWLRERCRVWAAKLDSHLAAIEAGQNVTEVRDAADETVNKLINAIRDRAKSVG